MHGTMSRNGAEIRISAGFRVKLSYTMEKIGTGNEDNDRICPECRQPLSNEGLCESYMLGCKNYGKQLAEPLKRHDEGPFDFDTKEHGGEKNDALIDKEKVSPLARETALGIFRDSFATLTDGKDTDVAEIKKIANKAIDGMVSVNNLNVASIMFFMEAIKEELSKLSQDALFEKTDFLRSFSKNQESKIRELGENKALSSIQILEAINKLDDELEKKETAISHKVNLLMTISSCVESIAKEKISHFQRLGIL